MADFDRIVAHLDMDAFYASVELLRRPELRGQPVVIGGGRASPAGQHPFPAADQPPPRRLGDYSGRGVVTTATYEARASGIHSGMGLMKAAALAPQALLLPVDFDEYRRLSRLFKAAVAELAPVIEDRGIDEIYLDLTDIAGVREAVGHDPLGGLRALAQDIKNNVRRQTGLSCSIGLAPNKLLAKLASEMEKPDGLTLLGIDALASRVWPLPVRKLNGIGPKAASKLAALQVHTLGDLAQQDPALLVEHFGPSYGAWLHHAAHGRDDRPVVVHSEPVSISRETTFERDLHPRNDRPELSAKLARLSERVAEDLQRKGYLSRTIGIKLRFDDFRTVTRDQTLDAATADAATVLQGARECLKRITLSRRLRLLGVRAGNLVRPANPDGSIPADARAAPLPGRATKPTARPASRLQPKGSSASSPASPTSEQTPPYTLSLFDDEPPPG